MGINLEKMKAKLEKLNQQGAGGVFWKPQAGEQTIRIVPTPDGDPFKEFWIHYGVGKERPFLSPKKNFGDDDPLDDFVRELYSDGGPESIKLAKQIKAKQRFCSPVIVRGEEEKGVRLWGYGKRVYQALIELCLNPEYGDIADVMEGTDLTIKYTKASGESFPQTSIVPKRRSSPIVEEDPEKVLEGIPSFDKAYTRKTPDDVRVILENFLMTQSEGESEKYGGGESSEIDSALSDLLKDKK